MKSLPFLFFALSTFAQAADITVSESVQSQIISLYSEGKCNEIRAITPKPDANGLRPNVLAIYAFCEPVGSDPEKLFALAEEKSPTGDLILVLHGKYRWKKNPKSSDELWRKVLMLARNEHFRDLAREYLAEVTTDSSNNDPLDLSPNTGFARLHFAGAHLEHPQPLVFSYDRNTASDNALLFGADLAYNHWVPFGSVSYHYVTDYQRNSNTSRYHVWENSLEVPVAVHVAQAKDIIFRPIFSYETVGARSFDWTYGVGVKGAVYKPHYVQSVQALIYNDHILEAALSPESGAHYRFEYAWDFYPESWFVSTLFAIDHSSSGSPTSYLGKTGAFEMSHNDFILNFKFDRQFSKFTLGFDPKLVARIDTNPSVYSSPTTGKLLTKAREDIEMHFNFNINVPILPSLQLYAWYEWMKISSNLGNDDYINRNFKNQTLGAGIKTSLSTY